MSVLWLLLLLVVGLLLLRLLLPRIALGPTRVAGLLLLIRLLRMLRRVSLWLP